MPPTASPPDRERLIQRALDANQRLLLDLKLQLDRINERSKQLDSAEQALLHAQTYRPPSAPGLSAFVDPLDGSTPAPNYDAAIDTLLYGLPLKTQLIYGRQTWTVSEHEMLHQAVRMQASMLHFDSISGTVASFSETSPEIADRIDWEAVASFVGRRTAGNCRREWTVSYVPTLTLSKRPFTIAELERLKQAEAKHNGYQWDIIAASVGGGRTPIECLCQFQQHLNPDLRVRWTPEEDATLLACSEEDPMPKWKQIAKKFGDRHNAAQCKQRLQTLTESIKKGPWTEAEDSMLVRACTLVGRQDWDEIARHVPQRSATQCRVRSKHQIGQLNPRPVWSEEDFLRFRSVCMQPSGRPKWIELAKEFDCSDNFVRKLYGTLHKKGYMQLEPTPASLKYVAKKVLKMACAASDSE
ncbi:Myblike DNAbinding domain-containing protein [Geranomyces michiganensis]|nr:Myblike DNAbinding domain-containing protein [Geranomyces michiganensis]